MGLALRERKEIGSKGWEKEKVIPEGKSREAERARNPPPQKKKKKGRGKTWRTCKKNRDRRLVRWVKGRVVSSGIRSRKRITCYPTYPRGIRPPWPSLPVLPPITSDPSSNVFSPHPFLHVHFSPASATIPDVVETNSSFPQPRKGMADRRKGEDRVIPRTYACLMLVGISWKEEFLFSRSWWSVFFMGFWYF